MAETITNWFVTNLQSSFAREFIVFIVSMLPILELRGGIIAGFALQMNWLPTFIIAFIGNLLPIPFILLFIRYIFKVLKKTPLRAFVAWCEKKADKKSDQIRKYEYWGVFLFVAVPLPGTGAWMGALISVLLNLNPKKTFPVIVLGVLTAGIIVSILSFGLLGSLGYGA
ncbi:putative small multi-drug export protein [Anaerotignum neopropionicum]|uniref:Putative small multi-drug export protein n=1 Tax=Anaerotignum neopropionicum TaxID=36847 RepID=A0A136WBP5_9FIRM|nr:small multi-drug export protein [Anaerotignum neopropionicum]KXL51943.1 putative small multi-drug export protein [Anaerotignum neopropionicum]